MYSDNKMENIKKCDHILKLLLRPALFFLIVSIIVYAFGLEKILFWTVTLFVLFSAGIMAVLFHFIFTEIMELK